MRDAGLHLEAVFDHHGDAPHRHVEPELDAEDGAPVAVGRGVLSDCREGGRRQEEGGQRCGEEAASRGPLPPYAPDGRRAAAAESGGGEGPYRITVAFRELMSQRTAETPTKVKGVVWLFWPPLTSARR